MKTFVILKYYFSELGQNSFTFNKHRQIFDEKQFSFKKIHRFYYVYLYINIVVRYIYRSLYNNNNNNNNITS